MCLIYVYIVKQDIPSTVQVQILHYQSFKAHFNCTLMIQSHMACISYTLLVCVWSLLGVLYLVHAVSFFPTMVPLSMLLLFTKMKLL